MPSLLTSFLPNLLKPHDDTDIIYDNFCTNMSLVSISTIIHHHLLSPHDLDDNSIESDLNNYIKEISENSKNMYENHRMYTFGMMMETDNIQRSEERVLSYEYFNKYKEKYRLSTQKALLVQENISTFLKYFFILEDGLKAIYIEQVDSSPSQHIKASELFSKYLPKILKSTGYNEIFWEQLSLRSNIVMTSALLQSIWSYLNLIRNILSHKNGEYNDDDKKKISKYYNAIIVNLDAKDLLQNILIMNAFEKYEQQAQNSSYVVVDNVLENIIRNTAIFIMETFHVLRVKN